MAQLSLFDATPQEPKVPRPPGRDKKRVEEKAAEVVVVTPEVKAIDSPAPDTAPIVVNDAPSSNAFHFEPAPVYTEEHSTPPSVAEALADEYVNEVKPVVSVEETQLEEEKTMSTGIQLAEETPNVSTTVSKEITSTVSAVSDKKNAIPKATSIKIKEALVIEEAGSVEIEEPSLVVDTTLLTKQYYSISEVAAMFKVNASHLRYWEKEFPTQLSKVRKNGKGDRFYTPKNIEQLQVLFYLVKTKKMTLEGARDYLKQKKRGIKSTMDASTLLQQVRGFLVSLKKELDD